MKFSDELLEEIASHAPEGTEEIEVQIIFFNENGVGRKYHIGLNRKQSEVDLLSA